LCVLSFHAKTSLTPYRLVLLGSTLWSDPADSVLIKEKLSEYWMWSERTARDRRLLHRFIYMNYANAKQDVMGGPGAENLEVMRRIKNVYDSENRFGSNWKGGFKL
jgi:hypothetical protein